MMSKEEIRQQVIQQTITDAINQLHKIEGEDRCSRIVEICEWLMCDLQDEEFEIEWWNPMKGEVGK